MSNMKWHNISPWLFFSYFGCEKVIYLSDLFLSDLIQKSKGFEGPYSEVFDFLAYCSIRYLADGCQIARRISWFLNSHRHRHQLHKHGNDIRAHQRINHYMVFVYGDLLIMTTLLTGLWWRRLWAIRVNDGNINRRRSQHWQCRKYRLRILVSTSSMFKWQGFEQ